MHVLRVLGVGDEHDGPLLKLQVSEAEQVVVNRQNPVPADREVRPDNLCMQIQGRAAAAAAAVRQPSA